MTIVVDAELRATLMGLGEPFEFRDEQGNLLGRFEPDEKSPAFREWLRNLDHGLIDEEFERRVHDARHNGLSTEQVLQRLRKGA
jgi:hypothetical protein